MINFWSTVGLSVILWFLAWAIRGTPIRSFWGILGLWMLSWAATMAIRIAIGVRRIPPKRV